jgi:hypothetical protein
MKHYTQLVLHGCRLEIATIEGLSIALVRVYRHRYETSERAVLRFWQSPDSKRLNDWAIEQKISNIKIFARSGNYSAEMPSYCASRLRNARAVLEAVRENLS